MFENDKFNIIYSKFQNKRMPHAILVNTNCMEKARNDLNLLIKKISCPNLYQDKCDKECNICYQLENNLIPSICDIYPFKMTIDRQQILNLKEKFLAKPLYLDYNIYIINYCEMLNFKSATTLLKFLEEPEDKILGFYLTENLEKILPTIRSRCEIFNVLYENTVNNSEDLEPIITKYLQYVKENHNITFVYNDVFLETNFERKDYAKMLKHLLQLFELKLYNKCQNDIVNEFNIENNIKIMELIKQAIIDIEANVNIELCLMLFSRELRNYYE